MVGRYILLGLVVFGFIFLVRVRLFYCRNQLLCSYGKTLVFKYIDICKCDEIKTNSLIKVTGRVEAIENVGFSGNNYKIGSVWINEQSNKRYLYGEYLQIIGNWDIRVTGIFKEQIWLSNYEIKHINDKKSFPSQFTSGMSRLRQHSQQVFSQILPGSFAGLLSGIVIGAGDDLDFTLWQALRDTGTLHIVAASGTNVTLFSFVANDALVKILNRRKAYYLSLIIILIYCFLAGGSPPVVRAGIMSGLALLGLAWGRAANAGWLLFISAVIMIFASPMLIGDTSFLLSISSMAGMIFIKPNLDKVANGKWAKSIVYNNLGQCWSAQIGTLPVMYFTFGQFQPLAFIPNLLVLPTIPILMLIGFISLFLGLIYLPLAWVAVLPAWPLLYYFVTLVEWLAKII